MKQTLEFRLGQHLAMTPQMRQAIRLLQLSSIELRAELREIAESNFMLELEDEQPRDEWDAGPAPEHGGRATEDLPEPEESLRDRLFWQLDNARLSKREHLIGTVVVDSIDARGYLDGSMDELIETLEDLGLGVEPKEVEAVLQRVQRFEPTGVGARTLAECLRRQLEELATDTPYSELALVVARSHLEAVARYDLAGLGRELGTSREELDGALALLRHLNPRPGAGYAGAPTEYISPDLRVFREGRKWKVELNPGTIPRVRINALYARFVRRGDRGSENQSLKQHLAEARSLLKSLGNRAETMLRVARAIVRHQCEFLARGDEGMRPLVLRDIASELGLHESTVSRVTSRKYVQTPRGVFELKHFFSSQISTPDGGAASAVAIRAHLRRIIEGEEPGRAWSDQRLAADLEQAGFPVARRTVAKYRESMGIPPSNERRRAGAANLNASA